MSTPMRTFIFSLVALTAWSTPAAAKSWCASPLWVHEWGVNVFGSDGGAATALLLPPFFHRARSSTLATTPVRNLPGDTGERDLPVLHFYSQAGREVPVGVEVGFSFGRASAWYPAVDSLQSPAEARQRRAATHLAQKVLGPLGPDDVSGRELIWDRLELAAKPAHKPADTAMPWLQTARAFESALWVNGASESERFVFYEGETTERVALALIRDPSFGPRRRAYRIANTGAQKVHDIIITHREGETTFVVSIAAIGAGSSATFVLEDHRAKDVVAATRSRLRASLVSPSQPPKVAESPDSPDSNCVMGRVPAQPFEDAASHYLYPHEADLIVSVWGPRFFDAEGTTIIYREDLAALKTAMPLAIYTNMHNYVVLHRAGLALWQDVQLP